MRVLPVLCLCLPCVLLAPPATAEMYKWTDAQGRVHFGDQPPAGQKKITTLAAPAPAPAAARLQPAPAPVAPPQRGLQPPPPPPPTDEPAVAEMARPTSAPTSAPASDSRSRMERQKRLADIMQQEREQAEEAERTAAEARAQQQKDCQHLRNYQRAIDGVPVYRLDENGERQFLNDNERRELDGRISEQLQASCE